MSSTQVTETNRGISLAIKVYKARVCSSMFPRKSFSPYLQFSSGGQSFKSFPSKKEGLSFSWDEYFTMEIEDTDEVTISLIQARFLFKDIALGEIKIPHGWFLKSKNIGWWKIYAKQQCMGKILVGFTTDENFKGVELDRLQVQFSIRSYLAKLTNVKNHRCVYKYRIKELLSDSEQDTKIYLSNLKSEREDVQMRIHEVSAKIEMYIARLNHVKDVDKTQLSSPNVSGHHFALSKKSTLEVQ